MQDTEITNTADLIDSREVIERIETLSALDADEITEDEAEELTKLQAFAAEAVDYSQDWEYGATLIHESYFTQYAEELAQDIGAINSEASWPLTYIDWEAAADALKMDYTTVDFDGATYYVR